MITDISVSRWSHCQENDSSYLTFETDFLFSSSKNPLRMFDVSDSLVVSGRAEAGMNTAVRADRNSVSERDEIWNY